MRPSVAIRFPARPRLPAPSLLAGALLAAVLLAAVSAPAISAEPPAARPSPATRDFEARCAAPGVVKCVGFDALADFRSGQVNPSADGRTRPVMDSKIHASGEGSLRFEIPSRSPANSSGYWADALGARFGEGKVLYFQFRQRFSREMLETRYREEGGWKQFILYQAGPSCTSVQLVAVNQYLRGLPILYAACGEDGLFVEQSDGDHLIQQGDFRCYRRDPRPGDCAMYVPDQWMTFYFQVDVGHYGKPDTRVQGWIGTGPGKLRQFIKYPGLTLNYADQPDEAFDQLQLTPYQTGKDPRQDHPVAYTWYDELIVSRLPIAAPAYVNAP